MSHRSRTVPASSRRHDGKPAVHVPEAGSLARALYNEAPQPTRSFNCEQHRDEQRHRARDVRGTLARCPMSQGTG